jgi:hypothetical protein
MAAAFALFFTWAACSAMESVHAEDEHDWNDHDDCCEHGDYVVGVRSGASRKKVQKKKNKVDRSKGRKNHSLGSKVPEEPAVCDWCNESDSECTKCDKCVESFDDIDDNVITCNSENCDPWICTCGPVSCAGPSGQRRLARQQARKLADMMMQLYSQNPGT